MSIHRLRPWQPKKKGKIEQVGNSLSNKKPSKTTCCGGAEYSKICPVLPILFGLEFALFRSEMMRMSNVEKEERARAWGSIEGLVDRGNRSRSLEEFKNGRR
jgi:hypothetical protein